nr:hypothetical protein [Candidatus Magasanikbacteria bacterium]
AFIEEYYRKGLEKLEYTIHTETKDKTHSQFFFTKEEEKIEGTVRIVDEKVDTGTDYVSLTVIVPSPE